MDNQIQLSEEVMKFVDDQVTQGGYESSSAYLSDLVRAEQRRKARQELDRLIQEGLASESRELTPEVWDEIEQLGLDLAERRKRP